MHSGVEIDRDFIELDWHSGWAADVSQPRNFPRFGYWGSTEYEEKLQHIDSEHPPDEEDCDDCACDVNYPVAGRLGSAEIEHDGMVARGLSCRRSGHNSGSKFEMSCRTALEGIGLHDFLES
jgi:hypothetical protein